MPREYRTAAGESLAGIALRELRTTSRWGEIRELNHDRYGPLKAHEVYPEGSTILLPDDEQDTPKKRFAELIRFLPHAQQEQAKEMFEEIDSALTYREEENSTFYGLIGLVYHAGQMSMVNRKEPA